MWLSSYMVLTVYYNCGIEQCEDQLRNYWQCLLDASRSLLRHLLLDQLTSDGVGLSMQLTLELYVLVPSGRATGSSYAADGGEADMLCLPDNPQ